MLFTHKLKFVFKNVFKRLWQSNIWLQWLFWSRSNTKWARLLECKDYWNVMNFNEPVEKNISNNTFFNTTDRRFEMGKGPQGKMMPSAGKEPHGRLCVVNIPRYTPLGRIIFHQLNTCLLQQWPDKPISLSTKTGQNITQTHGVQITI